PTRSKAKRRKRKRNGRSWPPCPAPRPQPRDLPRWVSRRPQRLRRGQRPAVPTAGSDDLPPPHVEKLAGVPLATGDGAYSPALDSVASKGAEGIYTDK